MEEHEPLITAIEGPDGKVRVSPPPWPEHKSEFGPDDLSRFAPKGTGTYGSQRNEIDPFAIAPLHESAGGVIYFSNRIEKDDLVGLTRILEMGDKKDYAAFFGESRNPGEDGYLRQLRLVSLFGLKHHFKALSDEEYQSFLNQELTMPQAIWAFIHSERKEWGTFFNTSPKLEGKFGGDGYLEREELSFGLMAENTYYGIYRIWSRAWLVTK